MINILQTFQSPSRCEGPGLLEEIVDKKCCTATSDPDTAATQQEI